jgi:hypothetical protein
VLDEAKTSFAVGFVVYVFDRLHDYATQRSEQSLQYLP